jgi:gamma-glutamyl-gamma-aminobutyrate hydrolase PuuD
VLKKLVFLLSASLLILTLTVNANNNTNPLDKKIMIRTLVIPSRNHTRMQPEIFYSFKTAVKKEAPMLKISFVLFNPFQSKLMGKSGVTQEYLMKLLENCVPEVQKIKKKNPESVYLLGNIKEYIKKRPNSSLAKTYKAIQRYMSNYQFLIVESSDTYGAHPMFYKAGVTNIELAEGACAKDLIETIYGLFFIDVALEESKPIWGTCHGSQIGYIHAGGRLGRLFEYDPQGYNNIEFRKTGKSLVKEEIWHIDKMLYTQKKGSDYKDYGVTAYPVPDEFKSKKQKDKKMFLNKDFQHSLALVEPVPSKIEVISYHPLSEYKKKMGEDNCKAYNEAFGSILKNQVIVDAYKYKTMLGTQYHPQYTYDDFDTSAVFDYLVRVLKNKYVKAEKTK